MYQIGSVDLVFPQLPPKHDAIGEYTALLGEELAKSARVRILTCSMVEFTSIPGVEIVGCYNLSGYRRFENLDRQLRKSTAEVTVLQYNPFSWGKRGWAPDLVRLWQSVCRDMPTHRWSLMFHETYTMNRGLKSLIMRQYQRWQFRTLLAASRFVMFSTQTWARHYTAQYPTKQITALPVGSNLPNAKGDPRSVRRRYGIPPDAFVCGVFGGKHPSRMFDYIERAAKVIGEIVAPKKTVLLHVGGETVKWGLHGVRIEETGRLDADQAALAVASMDVLLNPLTDGLSTRRGSVMAAIQHGVPVISTDNHCTEDVWRNAGSIPIYLWNSSRGVSWESFIRHTVNHILHNKSTEHGKLATEFYCENFSWPVIARRMLDFLG